MSTRPKAYSPALSLLAGIAALCLSSCEVPRLEKLDTDQADAGAQKVKVTLTGPTTSPTPGGLFTARSRLIIDGNLDVGPGISQDVPLTFVSTDELTAYLNIAPNAPAGGHTIAVGTVSGISERKDFFVRCAGCPPPPRLSDIRDAGAPSLSPLYKGNKVTVTLTGRNFKDNSPRVSISGSGLIPDPNFTVNTDPGGIDSCDLTITVAPDARTGYREIRVITSGGTSNALLLTVLAAPEIPRITGVTVSGSTSCVLRRGLNDLFVTGSYFDLATEIQVDFAAEGRVFHLIGANTSLQDPRTIFTQVNVDSAAPDSFSVIAAGIGGTSAPFPVNCNPEHFPILRALSPGVVTQGTYVYVKCEGENFHQGDPGEHRQQVLLDRGGLGGGGADLIEAYLPVGADEDKVIVVKLRVDSFVAPESSVAIYIVNQLGLVSNPVGLRIARPEQYYYISMVTPDFITRGGDAEITVEGSFFGTSAYRFFRFSTPGLTLSNPRTDPINLAKIKFDVHADPNAALTNDEATNLVLGNPIAFRVFPGTSSPTPTPTVTPTSTPRPTATPTATPIPTPTPTPTPAPDGPVITNITPSHVGTGVEVLIKCEGSGFGTSRQVITDPPLQTTTYLVASAAANPDRVVVAKILAQAAGPVRVRVRNLVQQTTSNEFILFVDNPAPGVPVAQGTTGDGVHRGGGFNLAVYGSNLEGITNASWSGIPGLTFSNTTYGSPYTTVHIEADGTAPLTTDEATNLTITTPAGQSPPFLFRVFQ